MEQAFISMAIEMFQVFTHSSYADTSIAQQERSERVPVGALVCAPVCRCESAAWR
jgi:hypothetical protein